MRIVTTTKTVTKTGSMDVDSGELVSAVVLLAVVFVFVKEAGTSDGARGRGGMLVVAFGSCFVFLFGEKGKMDMEKKETRREEIGLMRASF